MTKLSFAYSVLIRDLDFTNFTDYEFVYSVLIMDKDFRRKLMISGGQKETKAFFESSLYSLAV